MKKLILLIGLLGLISAIGCKKSETATDLASTLPGSGGSGGTGSCTNGNCKIFVTDVSNGNLGGISGADVHCQGSPFKPDSNTYKAILMAPGLRSLALNWVLKANTSYYRDNGTTLIGTTNSSGQLVLSAPIYGTTSYAWTGVIISSGVWGPGSMNCSNWTSSSSGVQGSIGSGNTTSNSLVVMDPTATGISTCASTVSLFCAEQ